MYVLEINPNGTYRIKLVDDDSGNAHYENNGAFYTADLNPFVELHRSDMSVSVDLDENEATLTVKVRSYHS